MSNRPNSPPFRVGGSMSYDDMFLQLKEDEMLAILGPDRPGSKGASIRDQLRMGVGDNPPVDEAAETAMQINAWDESEKQEAERIIKGLRANLFEVKQTCDVMKVQQDRLMTENAVITELLGERKLMSERSLAVASKVEKDYNALLYKLSLPAGEEKVEELSAVDKLEGFSSWRHDRATLGRRLQYTEKKMSSLEIEKKEAEEEAAKQKALFENADEEKTRVLKEQEMELKALREQLAASTSDATEQRAAKEALETQVGDAIKAKEYIALLEKTNVELNEKLESSETQVLIAKEKLANHSQRLEDLEDGLVDEDEEGLAARYTKEVKKNAELSDRLKTVELDLISQSQTIVANSNHLEKLESALDEKNGMNTELLEVNRTLEEQVSAFRADVQAKLVLAEEQQNELTRMRKEAQDASALHVAHQAEKTLALEVAQSEIAVKRDRVAALEIELSTAIDSHNTSFTNMTRIQEDLQAQLDTCTAELTKKTTALKDWEKKMSLFEIMEEMEAANKLRELGLMAKMAAAEGLRVQDQKEKDILEYCWKHTEDRLLMQQSDDFYLRLLDQERALTRRLRFDLKTCAETEESLHAEIRVISEGRELQQLEFEKAQKLSHNNVARELCNLQSAKTVEASLLNSIILGLRSDADKEAAAARALVAARDQAIVDCNGAISGLQQNIVDMEELLFNKETQLVRCLAENKDFRILEANRAHSLAETINSSVVEAKAAISADTNARAPRLRIAQLQELVVSIERKAQQWERVAHEYMWEAHSNYQTANDEGYQVSLSETDGNVYGVGPTSILEHTLGSIANKLVQTVSVDETSLKALRDWISDNNISAEGEVRALTNVLLSWPGLEAMLGLREIVTEYGTLQLQNVESSITFVEEQANREAPREKDADFQAEIEQRLFTLFEMGNVTVSEFRIMRELQTSLSVSVEDIEDILVNLNLPMKTIVDRALQDLCDRFELQIARDTCYDLGIIQCMLTSPGHHCDKEFIRQVQVLKKELDKATILRHEYAVLRSSYNQASTQMALLHDVNKVSARSRTSARGDGARRSPRQVHADTVSHFNANASVTSGITLGGDSTIVDYDNFDTEQVQQKQQQMHYHREHESHGSLTSVRSTLKKEVSEERHRRFDETRQRGMDLAAMSTMESRASRLIQRAEHNLQTLELELAEGGKEVDKSRIIFIKLLRNGLSREAAAKEESAVMAKRVKEHEQDAESYLVHLEEAIAALDLTDMNKSTQNDKDSAVNQMITRHIQGLRNKIRETNAHIEASLEAVLKGRDEEVKKNSARYRMLEGHLEKIQAFGKNWFSNQDVPESEALSLPLSHFSKTRQVDAQTARAVADVKWHLQDVRRKDAALERMHYLLHAFAGNIIDRNYKSQLHEVSSLLSRLQVVDKNGLGGGGENILSARVMWNNARIPSINTKAYFGEDDDISTVHSFIPPPMNSTQFSFPMPQMEEEDFQSLSLDDPEDEFNDDEENLGIGSAQDAADRSSQVEGTGNTGIDESTSAKLVKPPPGPSPMQGSQVLNNNNNNNKSRLGAPGSKKASSDGAIIINASATSTSGHGNGKAGTDLGYQQSTLNRKTKGDMHAEIAIKLKQTEDMLNDTEVAKIAKDQEEIQKRMELMHEMRTMKQDLLNELSGLREKPKPKEQCTIM